jgi:hypothetical protein
MQNDECRMQNGDWGWAGSGWRGGGRKALKGTAEGALLRMLATEAGFGEPASGGRGMECGVIRRPSGAARHADTEPSSADSASIRVRGVRDRGLIRLLRSCAVVQPRRVSSLHIDLRVLGSARRAISVRTI